MIQQLKKDFDILSLKVDMMTAIGRENLEEKGVVLDNDASLLRVIQNIKNISQSGGFGSLSYDSISYGKDPDGNDTLILEDDGVTYYAACEYENGKLKSIIHQGQTIELQYDGDKLINIGDTEIDLSGAPTNGSGETSQSNHSITSYEVWGETLNIAYDDSFEMNIAECTKSTSNIKSGVYKMFIDDNSYDALVIVEGEEIAISMNDGNMCVIAPYGGLTFFSTTIDVEGTHTIKLITQTGNVEDYVVYSENRSSDATTYIYITNGFTGGNVHINISVDDAIIFDRDVTFEGIDGYAFYHGNSNYDYHVPYLGQYIEQGKTIVIKIIQTNSNGVVTKTISSQPRLVDRYYVWGNSDLFVLPS